MGEDHAYQAADLRAENQALRRELDEARAALDAAREAQSQAAKRSSLLKKANDLLDRKLFQSTVASQVLAAAEDSEDLDQFCDKLFQLIERLVRVRALGIRLHLQGYTSLHVHAEAEAEVVSSLDALANGRAPVDSADPLHFVGVLGRKDAPIGYFVCLADEIPLTAQDRELLKAVCQQATPILEHNMLIRLLQEMAGFREDFVAMLAHDLRNPLTGVISSLSTMLIPGLPLDGTERESLLRTALDSARMVDDLIGDLLDVAKLEAGRTIFENEPVDMVALAEMAMHAMQPMASARRLAMTLEAPEDLPPVEGDERKLLRVLINLIGNALKYTQRGGVLLRLEARPGQVLVTVADTGLGIPLEAQSRLFEKFYQVARRGLTKGTGLGLAYCRQMVEAHGGTIWLESPSRLAAEAMGLAADDDALGTAFYVALPTGNRA